MKFKTGKGLGGFFYLAMVLAIIMLSVGVMSYSYSGTSSYSSTSGTSSTSTSSYSKTSTTSTTSVLPTTTSSSSLSTKLISYTYDYNKFEPEVLDKLNRQNYVFVIVYLKDEGILLEAEPEEGEFFDAGDLPLIREQVREKQDSVLSGLPESAFKLKHRYKVVNGFSGEISKEGLSVLSQNGNVDFIYADKVLYPALAESIPLINADDAHNVVDREGRAVTGEGQVVCVIDTGIDYTHPDLGGCTTEEFLAGQCEKVVGGVDMYDIDFDPMDERGHGTEVAGVLAANGGIQGVAPDAKLVAMKVCGDSTEGCSSASEIGGVDWCIDNSEEVGISIITSSIGGGAYSNSNCPTWMNSVINLAYSFNIPFTAASGNIGSKNGISYPACARNVISVGAVYDADAGSRTTCLDGSCTNTCTDSATSADMITCYSNSGNNLDVVAPGELIRTTQLGGGYVNQIGGTSLATPHVAGVIALMKQYNTGLNVDDIVSVLREEGVMLRDSGNGLDFPRIDAMASLVDLSDPEITCPSDIVLECSSSNGQSVDIGSASGVDNVDAELEITNNAPDLFNMGETIVTWIARDDSGNSAECRQRIVIEDTTAPRLICSADVTFLDGEEVVLPEPEMFDVCSLSMSVNNNAPAVFPVGRTNVVWTAVDESRNSAQCTTSVTIESTEPEFKRGDSNTDGKIDISDASNIFNYLFFGTGRVSCLDAADANDDGAVDISDGSYVLNYLFLGGTPPRQPFPAVGNDPTDDELGCEEYAV